MTFTSDLKFALRSLARVKGLAVTVVLTLALGIGANAAIFSVVRGVLLRPLVNRDEDRLIYIRQSAKGLGTDNTTFSVPEIQDLRERVTTVSAFGDFSTIGFTMVGLGEPRVVRAGVVGGSYFSVMGLHPVIGRLLDAGDDGPKAAGAAVLTYRFWSTALERDPSVIGKTVRLDTRSATIVGVLEPSVPYPAETEIIANVVTSPHHLSATMVTGRVHRMTELFGRLAPGADLDAARAELRTVHGAMLREHPESYSPKAEFRIEAVRLRDQITSNARTVLLVLLGAAALVFVIACSNVANLILARSVRREGELAIRAALGAGTGVLRRTLLAESLLLCGAGAALGVLIAWPMVAILARYAARFSVRALDLTVDLSVLWVGVALAIVAAVLLAFVPRLPPHHAKSAWWGPRLPPHHAKSAWWGPRLPSAHASHGFGLSSGSLRITSGTNRRLRAFAVTQIAASFVLLAGAGMLLATLMSLQATQTGFDMRRVLAIDVPVMEYGRTPDQIVGFYKEVMRRIAELPGVERVAVGTVVPWRDAGGFGPGFQFSADGHVRAPGEEDPRARFRTISPGFFAALGVPFIAGRDFNDADRRGGEPVVIVSQSLAQRMFPNQDAVNRHMMWTDPVMKFIDVSTRPRRIVGVVADVDDENVVPGPAFSVYHPFDQEIGGGRLFVHARTDPYALVSPIIKIIRTLSADQPIERPATLADVRAEVLAPDRLNTLVFGGFAGVALMIAIVGVAGVLAFSVSGRTREFGIRLAIGSQPRHLLTRVLGEGVAMAGLGVVSGAVAGFVLARFAAGYIQGTRMP
ncbi:MAG TPA: ABC transporter permease, partial [Candidatus Elarobacter sp.]|nr:ABC transporter permease [Candidatus Elarobacter sp.]